MTKVSAKDIFLKNRLAIGCAVLACLFFAGCFWQPMIYISFPILTLFMLCDDLNHGFSYIMFTIPFSVIGGSMGLVLFLMGIGLFLGKFYIVTIFKDKIKINKNVAICFGLFLLYCFLPIGKYNANFFYKLAFLSFIIITIWVLANQRRVINFRYNIRIMCIGLVLSCLFSIAYFISPYLQESIHMIPISGNIVRYQAVLGHPNALGTICSLAISFMAYSFIKEGKWYDIALVIVVAFIGVFSFSKTYLVIMLLVILTVAIYLFKNNYRLAIGFTIAALVAIGLFIVVFPEFYKIFYDRFLENFKTCQDFRDVMNMITTGRWDLWAEYLYYLVKNPVYSIFGCGLGAEAIHELSAHNAYISMIYQLGIVGSLLFILTIVFIVRARPVRQDKKTNKAVWLPITVIALIFLIEDIMFYIM